MKKIAIVICCIFLFVCLTSNYLLDLYEDGVVMVEDHYIQKNSYKITEEELCEYIKNQVNKEEIPGLAIAIVNEDQEKVLTYGYSDVKKQIRVNENSRFEIGSNSKAFTAYAIYQLIEQKKICLEDAIGQYLSGYHLYYTGLHDGIRYENVEAEVTIQQLLNHTSGITEDTIVLFSEDNVDESLENIVYRMNNCLLKHYPGTVFEYATLNYDILGLIIEKVSGISYEEYMKKNIFDKNNLYNTSANINVNTSTGYKYDFWGVREFQAPVFKGNVPAGYISSSINDMNDNLSTYSHYVEIAARGILFQCELGFYTYMVAQYCILCIYS